MELNEASAVIDPLEHQQNTACPPLKRSNHGRLFTTDTAKAAGQAGGIAKTKADRDIKASLEEAKSRLDQLHPLLAERLAQAVVIVPGSDDHHRIEQLARTRKCLAALYSDFDRTTDPKERKFLADAIARLSDVEFALAGRPKPGARRPAPEKAPKKESGSGLVED